MAYLVPVLFASYTVATQAFRVTSVLGHRARCTPVMARHLCKPGMSDLNLEDKKCISQLCDEKGKQACCDVRDALLVTGVPADQFKYADDTVIRMPTTPHGTSTLAPTLTPTSDPSAALTSVPTPSPTSAPTSEEVEAEAEEEETPQASATTSSSMSHLKFCKKVRFAYTLNHSPHLYMLEEGEVGAQTSEQCSHGKLTQGEVFFECKERDGGQKWTLVSQTCHAPPGSGCPAHEGASAAKVQVPFMGNASRTTTYSFDLPEQPNSVEEDILVSVKCPQNARNIDGAALYACHPSGKWSFKNETCSEPASGVCYPTEVSLAVNENENIHEMAFTIPEKGPDVPYTDGEEVEVPCKFGKYNRGVALLTCENGAWTFNSQHCKSSDDPAIVTDSKVCNKMDYTYTLKQSPHIYTLEQGKLGDEASEQCSHGKLTEGEVFFECKERSDGELKWTLVNKTCHAPPGSGCDRMEAALDFERANGETIEWMFNLEETEGSGEYEFPCPDDYTGIAKFKCTLENEWEYMRNSATCKKVD